MQNMPDEWKHTGLAEKQLALNLKQLSHYNEYPPHWVSFLQALRFINKENCTLYDLGCGVGSTYKLLQDNSKTIRYVGIDFSESMIECAKNTWKYPEFYVDDLFNTTIHDYSDQIIYCNGLLDILPNGCDALRKLLKRGAKYALLNRLNFGNYEDVQVYKAYELIECIKYTFNRIDFDTIVQEYGYTQKTVGSCVILTKL